VPSAHPFGHANRLSALIDTAAVPVETTTVPPQAVQSGPGAFAISIHLDDVQHSTARDVDGEGTDELLRYHVPSGSVATVLIPAEATAAGEYPVRQLGPRRLWTEAESAHAWWRYHHAPGHTQFGLTISG
jgi:hypothetical protein